MNDKALKIGGLVLTVLAIVVSFTIPEIRQVFGLDKKVPIENVIENSEVESNNTTKEININLEDELADNSENSFNEKVGLFQPIERRLGDILVIIENIVSYEGELQIDFKAFNDKNNPMYIGVFTGDYQGNQTRLNIDGDLYYSTSAKVANNTCKKNWYVKEMINN